MFRLLRHEGPSRLAPWIHVRLLLIGYLEGSDSERGIAGRAADPLALRDVPGLDLHDVPPDRSTISRTRRLIVVETHRAVFPGVAQCLGHAGLTKGKTIGRDATTLEANAALRSLVRRDTGEGYEDCLTRLAKVSGIGTPTRADLARLDRTRKKKGSNDEWTHPRDPDAKVTTMKDGRTHLAPKAEHAIDLETLEIRTVSASLTAGHNRGSINAPNAMLGMPIGGASAARGHTPPSPPRRRARTPPAHLGETGGPRRAHVRGHENVLKRLLVHASAFNLGLWMRRLFGVGIPLPLQGRSGPSSVPRGRGSTRRSSG